MSLARLITNLTLVLQKKVDNNYIDDITMLNILSDTLNKIIIESYNADIDMYKQIIPSTINNNVNITIKTDTIKENVLLSKTTTNSDDNVVTKRQSWCDIESDDDWTPNSNIYINNKNDNNNNDNNTNTHNIKTYNNDDNNNDDNNNDDNNNDDNNNNDNNNNDNNNNKHYTNNTSKYHNYYGKNKKKEQQRQQKIKSNNISESVLQKFQKNCEKTITYFIHNYKTNHIDSAHNIEDLNLIIIRLLGINLEDEQPQAYTNVCWFMRNTKCYYTECTANNYNMCTYAHPRNNKTKTIQYCCVNEDEYDTWPENYYKCLKLDYNDNINEYIKKNGNNPLPLNTYKYIPISIIEWYSEMIKVLKK